MDRAGNRESSPGPRMHSRRGGARGHMVSGSNGQSSRHHGKHDQVLHQIKEVVERQHQGKKEVGWKGKKEETKLGRGCQSEGRTPEVNLTVQEENVERVLAKPGEGRGIESSTIREPSGRHDRRGLNRQSREPSKHIIERGGDAEARVLPSE